MVQLELLTRLATTSTPSNRAPTPRPHPPSPPPPHQHRHTLPPQPHLHAHPHHPHHRRLEVLRPDSPRNRPSRRRRSPPSLDHRPRPQPAGPWWLPSSAPGQQRPRRCRWAHRQHLRRRRKARAGQGPRGEQRRPHRPRKGGQARPRHRPRARDEAHDRDPLEAHQVRRPSPSSSSWTTARTSCARLTSNPSPARRNNPLLVGAAGVGKTAVVEGLAQKIVAGDVPESLKNRRLLSIDLSTLMTGVRPSLSPPPRHSHDSETDSSYFLVRRPACAARSRRR